MFGIVLYQPEIPPNTGNIIRLCANTGARLHLVRPLGFSLDDAQLRRAGLDYHEYARLQVYDSLEQIRAEQPRARWLALSTRGRVRYDQVRYGEDDLLLFGPEITFRAQPHATFKFLFNGVLYGAATATTLQ